MTNRNLVLSLFFLGNVLMAGWLFSWWLACGVFIGAISLVLIYHFRYSVIDEIEAEVQWQKNWYKGKAEEYEEDGIMVGRWTGFWRVVVLLVALLAVVTAILFGLAG